jgi:hypothetical protein
VLAAEHLVRLRGIDLRLEVVEATCKIGRDVFAGVGPFDQYAEIIGAALQRPLQRLFVFESPPPLHDSLRFGLVVPETGLARPLFYIGKLFVQASGFKDASAVPPPGR